MVRRQRHPRASWAGTIANCTPIVCARKRSTIMCQDRGAGEQCAILRLSLSHTASDSRNASKGFYRPRLRSMMPMGSGIRNQIAARSRMSFGKIWMISPCTCLAHQRWPVVKFGQHIAGMMHPLARPMNPRLEHSTWIVVAAGGDRHTTSRDARSMVMSHNEAFNIPRLRHSRSAAEGNA
jgi:hypothetical protein